MKKVFSHENRLIVFNMKNLLEEQGIECMVKNEFACGGVGELAPFETWPELWIADANDLARAETVIAGLADSQPAKQGWVCAACGETNEANFQLCWNCSAARPADS